MAQAELLDFREFSHRGKSVVVDAGGDSNIENPEPDDVLY